MKKISIVMRSKNDVEFIRRTIEGILSQSVDGLELLSFDNESKDGTVEIIKEYPQIKRFTVKEGEYVPGKVLNRAVCECSGEIVVFNNADAIPQNPDWLKNLIKPVASGKFGAAYARQVCRSDALPWVASDYFRTFGDNPLSPEFFSMASSAADMRVLKKYPFDENIRYSEDALWAKNIRENGIETAYASDALAEHSHNYHEDGIRRRFSGEGLADAQIFGTPQSRIECAKGILGACLRDFVFLAKRGEFSKFSKCIRARLIQKTSYYKARQAGLGGKA